MPRLNQIQRKERWGLLKDIIRYLRRPMSKRQIITIVTALVVIIALTIFMVNRFEQKKIEKEERLAALKAKKEAALEAKKNRPFSPDDIVIPEPEYSFYAQLENRSFHISGEEEHGGMQFVEPPEKPKFELISEPTGYAEVDAQIKAEVAALQPPKKPVKVEPEPPKKPVFKRLQTGSFSSSFEAKIHHKQLEALGYTPQIVHAEVRGRTVYRVQIGPFAPNELAQIKRHLEEQQLEYIEVRPQS